jgi:hypothetical protein
LCGNLLARSYRVIPGMRARVGSPVNTGLNI